MGNWRTVTLKGTVPADEVEPLRDSVRYDYMSDDAGEHEKYGPLAYSPRGSLCGLGGWPSETVDSGGNCFERDFDVEDIAEHLRRLVKVAPGMSLKVHCGGDWEDEKCVATVTVADGVVTVGEPEVAAVHGVPQAESMARMMGFLMRP
jgi:hypothetical protein